MVDTRGTLNLTERSPGSAGGGVVTMTDGMPSIRVREARIVWSSTSNKLRSVGRGDGLEGNGSNTGVEVVLGAMML
jgi:hypothetical protein